MDENLKAARNLVEIVSLGAPPLPRTLIVAAHPDDETAGCGSRLARFSQLAILHVTDGAPLDSRDAEANGFAAREHYAAARRAELETALRCCGVNASTQAFALGIVDQRASFHLVDLTGAIVGRIQTFAPELILTHPYEGGHPDHDACSFAVHAAVKIAGFGRIGEFASYHSGPNGVVASDFLPHPVPVFVAELTTEERELKQCMLDAFTTQRDILTMFSRQVERYRPAPAYDFCRPPHPGPLFYENFPWGMTGTQFRELAANALEELRLANPL